MEQREIIKQKTIEKDSARQRHRERGEKAREDRTNRQRIQKDLLSVSVSTDGRAHRVHEGAK